MGDLENKVNEQVPQQKKHGDKYYLNKELIVGQIAALGSTFAGAWLASQFTDSKEHIAIYATIADSVGFNAGYITCAYFDRRKDYAKLSDFAKYLLKFVSIVGVPSSICYHAAHSGAIYIFQNFDIPPEWAAVIAHIPATGVLIGVANTIAYFIGIVKSNKDLCPTSNDKDLKSADT